MTIQLDTMHDFNVLGLSPTGGFEKEFITGDIPLAGTVAARRTNRSGISPDQSKWILWASTPTDRGDLKVYTKFNLTKDVVNTEFQMYRTYGEWGGLRGAYDYTLWLNQDTIPNTLDFEGPNSIPETRFGQVSYQFPITFGFCREHTPWYGIFGMEDAPADMTLPTTVASVGGYAQTPSLIGKLGFQPDWAHIEFSGLWRLLGAVGANDYDSQVSSWGLMLDGMVKVGENDNIIIGVLGGQGLGIYIDDTAGYGLDAAPRSVADPQLRAIPAFGYWVAYQHIWNDKWQSTATYGLVKLDNEFFVPASRADYPQGMMCGSQYASINLIWQPRDGFEVGLEYLYGMREVTENTTPVPGGGQTGLDHRLQLTLCWAFSGKHTPEGHQKMDLDHRRSPRFY